MAIKEADQENFNMLLRAAAEGVLALVESKCAETGEYRAVICAVTYDDMVKEYFITPFGHMCTGNPYEDYADPTQENLDG